MLFRCTKENIKIHYELVTDVTTVGFLSYQGITWFECVRVFACVYAFMCKYCLCMCTDIL